MICMHCGATMPEGVRFCGFCGKPMPVSGQQSLSGYAQQSAPVCPQQPGTEPKKNRNNGCVIALIIVVIVAVLACLALLLLGGDGGDVHVDNHIAGSDNRDGGAGGNGGVGGNGGNGSDGQNEADGSNNGGNSGNATTGSIQKPSGNKTQSTKPTQSTFQGTIRLKKLSSTGEIPYSKFSSGECVMGQDGYYGYTELFPYTQDGKYGYADAYGNVVIRERFEAAEYFSENKAFVKEDGRWKVIDPKGNVLYTASDNDMRYPLSFSRNGVSTKARFVNGKAILVNLVESDVEILVIDETMATREFTITPNGRGVMYLTTYNTPEFAGILTISAGKEIKKEIPGSYLGMHTIYYHHNFELFDLSGTCVWKETVEVEDYVIFTDDFVVQNGYMNIVNKDGKWGLLNLKTGKTVIPCQYDYVGAVSEGLVPVCSYDKWGYYDVNGNLKIKPEFQYTTPFVNGSALVRVSETGYQVIDKTGVPYAEYTSTHGWTEIVCSFSGKTGLAVLERHRDYALISTEGKFVLSETDEAFDYISDKYVFDGKNMYEIIGE